MGLKWQGAEAMREAVARAAQRPAADRESASPLQRFFFFFFINLQPIKRLSTTNYAPFVLDPEPGCLTDILRPS